jgi:hypothetical protein
MGQELDPIKDYRVPVSIFDAANDSRAIPPSEAPEEKEEKKETKKERSSIERDFLFPIHLIF